METDFTERLNNLSTIAIKNLINGCGIKRKYATILNLHYIEELENEDIAERLNMTSETVSNTLCKARKR